MDSLKSDFSHRNFAESMYKHKTCVFMLLAKSALVLYVFQALRGGKKGHVHYGWVLVSVLNLLES